MKIILNALLLSTLSLGLLSGFAPMKAHDGQPIVVVKKKKATKTSPCDGVPSWSATIPYIGGNLVVYQGHLWKARYWTQGDIPGQIVFGPWDDMGAC